MDTAEPENSFVNKCLVCSGEGTHFCAKCRHARYCSRECQVADWKKHSGSCARSRKYVECAVARIRGNIDIMAAHHDSSIIVKIQESLDEFMCGSLVDEAPHFAYLYVGEKSSSRTVTVSLDDFSCSIPLTVDHAAEAAARKYPCPDPGWSVLFMM